jgi:hypothetical protein
MDIRMEGPFQFLNTDHQTPRTLNTMSHFKFTLVASFFFLGLLSCSQAADDTIHAVVNGVPLRTADLLGIYPHPGPDVDVASQFVEGAIDKQLLYSHATTEGYDKDAKFHQELEEKDLYIISRIDYSFSIKYWSKADKADRDTANTSSLLTDADIDDFITQTGGTPSEKTRKDFHENLSYMRLQQAKTRRLESLVKQVPISVNGQAIPVKNLIAEIGKKNINPTGVIHALRTATGLPDINLSKKDDRELLKDKLASVTLTVGNREFVLNDPTHFSLVRQFANGSGIHALRGPLAAALTRQRNDEYGDLAKAREIVIRELLTNYMYRQIGLDAESFEITEEDIENYRIENEQSYKSMATSRTKEEVVAMLKTRLADRASGEARYAFMLELRAAATIEYR